MASGSQNCRRESSDHSCLDDHPSVAKLSIALLRIKFLVYLKAFGLLLSWEVIGC